ncbi:conserved oligomeric Golgi complex subunit 8-like isoform X1 [Varroa destructor]|uniref:Conserved oligomeric Golgi complex subunit 8 n=1 Tax=Varroa destructor TaxID=109461 RepID=A0A7M7JN77_VARDE|nr:conserved oligomeric Golgi complex subunit 8-like isoform X1 [Varroa destructor]XP_022649879.1 conserved oligomeric Golgi complex subunit 8-like isoform X1 [Varroa destructor]XP_022649880.1 conserved oligomeric Golgi complex subunit 8-like isoform X1 [Varroa destructor]XP_022649881.1 conserved oligomeric Golgi complex subunit 8-like isoform X1 [Varroa destructor]
MDTSVCDEPSSYLELLSVLDQPRLAELWDPDTEDYMNELSGMGLQRLIQEPQRLHEEHTALVDATQELAFNNYKTFVQTANCGRDIRLQMAAVGKRLESLRRKLPMCATGCDQLSSTCKDITARWKLTSQTLSRHKRLVEILEIPQLMETCVKNGNFDEALELAAHVKRLERRHGHIPLVATIGREVRHQQALMQSHLLTQLRGPVQLPACLRLIGHLRRMEMHSAHELKARFLETRGAWFDSLLIQAEAAGSDSQDLSQDAYSRLGRLLELYRVHLFDLITQYKAIFPAGQDEEADSGEEDICLFQGWLVSKIEGLLQQLRKSLAADPECRLDAMISQCMYAGLSFSRVGADFRPLLTPIFQDALTTRCDAYLAKAHPQCLQMIQHLDLVAVRDTVDLNPASVDSFVTSAPASILVVPPLTVYCNALLSVFNELRVCPLASAIAYAVSSINAQLTEIAETIRGLHSLWSENSSSSLSSSSSSLTNAQQRGFQRLTEIFATDLVPFAARTFEALFPTAMAARLIGCSLPQVEELIGCRINIADVTRSLAEFVFQEDIFTDNNSGCILETTKYDKKGAPASSEANIE